MENLVAKIEKEAIRQRRKQAWITFLQSVAGVLSMFLLPALVIHLCKIPVPEFSFSFPKIDVNFDPNIVMIGLAVLLLLIIDTLYSNHLFHTRFGKKHETPKH
jgi:NADH:ubiquinone oxidoreductase subunit 5 (subunit L)/multisubunit Na+/H+ antiporter MnhA subunit